MSRSPAAFTDLDQLSINTIRVLSADAVQKANSGHPGLPMGAAPMAHVLWSRHLRVSPSAPTWPNRDRFVLSGGHGSMLLYSLLHLAGFALKMSDLQNFRQWGSLTPGHPEFGLTPGVDATTGPLGQGATNGVGMAMAEAFLAGHFNRPGFPLVDHYTYVLASDGDIMEGVTAESASLAGHLKLGKLIVLYDSNGISLDGPTTMTFSTENVGKRYEAYGWQVLHVEEGDHDLTALNRALTEAKAERNRPTLIIVTTTIGYGSPHLEGTSEIHGKALGEEELALTKKALGFPAENKFYVPPEVYEQYKGVFHQHDSTETEWRELLSRYRKTHPDLAREWALSQAGELPAGWEKDLPVFKPSDNLATRESSGKVMNYLASQIPWFLGGDADLSCSTNTALKGMKTFGGATPEGRNIHYGVREHAMASISNGIQYHGGVRDYVSTFFCFSDYMRPAIRLAAMNHLAPIYVWTHDSVGLGEDGPTHQPIEHLAALRALPNILLIRPGDANETAVAWKVALQSRKTPVGLVLTRQKVPTLDRTRYASAEGLIRGAYVLSEASKGAARAIVMASGSEVSVALEAQKVLEEKGVPTRVVSFPCWELFAKQDLAYRDSVLLPSVRARVSVEAGATFGWERWIGDGGKAIGIDRFGASAPGPTVLQHLGIHAKAVVDAVNEVLSQ